MALATDGADGVRAVVDLLREELETALALCGTLRLELIDEKVLGR
jgi:isopentenyl diphosphate isomerase/L-lactate dehydrogenase-like FMN-dependent dehydrogenase